MIEAQVSLSGSTTSSLVRLGLATSMRRRCQPMRALCRGVPAMAAKYLDYYTSVADRMLPFLQGRQAAIGFHAHIRSEDRGAWFVIDIDSRNLPTEMAQRAAIHAADVLAEQGIDALVKFSGSDGFHLMWDVPDLGNLDDDTLWELERAVVRTVACEVERRLVADPEASPIWEAVGAGNRAITTGSADRENPNALLFDEYILKDSANFRVPYSIHPTTGLVAAPLTQSQLATFRPRDASPEAVVADWPAISLPRHSLQDVQRALDAWHEDGC